MHNRRIPPGYHLIGRLPAGRFALACVVRGVADAPANCHAVGTTALTDLTAAMQAREAARAAKGEPPAYIVEAEATGTPVTWVLPGHGLVRRYPSGRCVRLRDGVELRTTGWGYPVATKV